MRIMHNQVGGRGNPGRGNGSSDSQSSTTSSISSDDNGGVAGFRHRWINCRDPRIDDGGEANYSPVIGDLKNDESSSSQSRSACHSPASPPPKTVDLVDGYSPGGTDHYFNDEVLKDFKGGYPPGFIPLVDVRVYSSLSTKKGKEGGEQPDEYRPATDKEKFEHLRKYYNDHPEYKSAAMKASESAWDDEMDDMVTTTPTELSSQPNKPTVDFYKSYEDDRGRAYFGGPENQRFDGSSYLTRSAEENASVRTERRAKTPQQSSGAKKPSGGRAAQIRSQAAQETVESGGGSAQNVDQDSNSSFVNRFLAVNAAHFSAASSMMSALIDNVNKG
jgi:hypothetical protein